MTEKRFDIIKSVIIDGAKVIRDNENKYTFATTFETATLISYRKALNELNDENEQLKLVVKEVIELLSEEVDVFSDKATEHDINAYVELKELDNKDAYYMATATKKAINLLKEVIDDC